MGQLPNDWKIANVVPIHKKGDKSDVNNYRPISLTSLVVKVMEIVLEMSYMINANTLLVKNNTVFFLVDLAQHK